MVSRPFSFVPPRRARYNAPMKKLMTLALPITLLIAGCGAEDNEPGPGGVSVGEAKALDEAAEMIEARRPEPGVIPEPAAPAAAPVATPATAHVQPTD